MKTFFVAALAGLFSSFTPAHAATPVRLNEPALTFTYASQDGSFNYACKHQIENADAQDWSVTCFDDSGILRKKYIVHLWLTAYEHVSGPTKLSYELLYWITDWTDSKHPKPQTTTVWFNLKDAAALTSLDVSAGVDGDQADLRLRIQL